MLTLLRIDYLKNGIHLRIFRASESNYCVALTTFMNNICKEHYGSLTCSLPETKSELMETRSRVMITINGNEHISINRNVHFVALKIPSSSFISSYGVSIFVINFLLYFHWDLKPPVPHRTRNLPHSLRIMYLSS